MTQRQYKARRRKNYQPKPAPTASIHQLSGKHTLIAGIAVFGAIGLLQYFSPESRQIREMRADIRQQEKQAEADTMSAALNAQEGNRRFREKCAMAYVGKPDVNGYYHEIVTLREGMVIRDANTGAPIADGQLVCDHTFMTYEIVKGKTAKPARANDTQAVLQRFNDYVEWHPKARRGAILEEMERE